MSRAAAHRSPRPDPAGEEDWALLFRLAWMMREHFLAIARELDLSPPQAGAIQQLDPATPVPMGELAVLMHCDASTVTGLVDRLEARGLVERRVSASDRRVKDLVMTARGRELRDRFSKRLRQPPPGIARLSAADRRALRTLLERAFASGPAAHS